MALNSSRETGLNSGIKTTSVFEDLTAANDTEWRTSLIYEVINPLRLGEAIRSKRQIYAKIMTAVAARLYTGHTSLLDHKFLTKYIIVMILQPPNSLDMACCDIFLFPKLKRKFRPVVLLA